jgi:predicted Zn-dependent protease
MTRITTILLSLLLTTSAFAQQRGLTLMTPNPEQEIEMGRQMATELEQNMKFKDDAALTEYVDSVVQKIVRNSDAKVPFKVRVIDSDEITAVALPGASLYVSVGLINAAGSEAELAAAIAHQVAHITARHAAQQMGKANVINVASIPLMNSNSGIAAMAIQQAASIGIPLNALAFNRQAELEADYLGLQYLYKAGYIPSAMTATAVMLSDDTLKGKKVSPVFATHPPTGERIAALQKSIDTYLPPRDQYLTTTPAFEQIKASLKK